MPDIIQAIFVTPSLAFARLGGSSTPQGAFDWVDNRVPRSDGETTIAPAWTLAVQPDGSVQPFMPDTVTFRDGELIRPVAPFFEIWARVGAAGSAPAAWQDTPLTPVLLADNGMALAGLVIKVTARNLKAARRTGDTRHAFGTFPSLTLTGSDHSRVPVQGISPPNTATPMIPAGRRIPLGSVQILRSVPQPTGQPWSDTVNVEVIRFRFTPAAGLFYGPPEAAQALPQNARPTPAVRPENAFLDRNAGWHGTSTGPLLEPGDTYDVINQRQNPDPNLPPGFGPSLGVVDDTCEVHFEVSLQRAGAATPFIARAATFVGPPDFAPDRRPFLSVADELNDRAGDAAQRNAAISGVALDRWVEDLFERVYETVSLFNADMYRAERAAALPLGKRTTADIDQGARDGPIRAMGGQDALRNKLFKLPGETTDDPLPLSAHARMRHRALSDLQGLIELVSLDPGRLKSLVRQPFEAEAFENGNQSSMRMPPFMRQSNAGPLTLASWQYDLLMRWVTQASAHTTAGIMALSSRPMSEAAANRRARVLARIDAGEGRS